MRRGVQHGPNPPAGLIQRRLARQETFSPLLLLGAWHRQPLADTGAFPPPPVVCPYRPARVDEAPGYAARPDPGTTAALSRPDEAPVTVARPDQAGVALARPDSQAGYLSRPDECR